MPPLFTHCVWPFVHTLCVALSSHLYAAQWDALEKNEDGTVAKAAFMALFTASGGEEKMEEAKTEEAPAEPAPNAADAVRKSSIGGGNAIEVYASVKGRAIWQWDAAGAEDFFSEDNFCDEEGEAVVLTGDKPAATTGTALLKGEAGLNEADGKTVQAMLSHTAALFMGDLALIEDADQRTKMLAEFEVAGDHVPFLWSAEATIAKLDELGIKPETVASGYDLYCCADWDMADEQMEKLAAMLESEAMAFMVEKAQ